MISFMRSSMRSISSLLAASCALFVHAQAPSWLNFQGKLTTGSGASLSDGSYLVTFRLYSAPAGGSAVWTETKTVQLRKGVFSSALGLPAIEGGVPFGTSAFTGRRWLGVTVGNGTEMVPRQELGAVPFALGVPASSISSSMLQDNSVISSKIADGSITTSKLANDAVTSIKLASDVSSLAKVTGGVLAADPIGIQTTANKYMGLVLSDKFLYGTSNTGHYSLGWYDNDPSGWASTFGTTMRVSAYGGIKLFTLGTWRFGIHPSGHTITKGQLFVDNHGWGGNPSIDLAVGDNDSGLNWGGDGILQFCTDNVSRMELRNDRLVTTVGFYGPGFLGPSSRKLKFDIKDMSDQLGKVMQLKPVSYRYKSTGLPSVGFIAEEVDKLYPEIVGKDAHGRPDGIDYSKFSAILVEAMQEQEARHQRERAELSRKLESMEARLAKLERGR